MSPLARTAFATLVLFGLTGCGMRMPFFASSSPASFFKTAVCGVHIDGKSREARLRIELTVTKPLPRNGFVEVEFENPLDRTIPITSSRTVTGQERTLQLLSPALQRVRARGYETVTRVYASDQKKQVLGVHTHVCQSLVDDRDMGPQLR